MAEHTPGPWVAKFEAGLGWIVDGVCVMQTDYEGTEADAHLIAAAPDLLDAMRHITECDISPGGWGGPRALKIAKAAIARAEGKENGQQ